MSRLLILLSCLICALCLRDKGFYNVTVQGTPENDAVYAQQQHTFDQVIDHFDYRKSTTFKQRYWVIRDYFKSNYGPVLLFICGQYVCQGVPQARQWIITLAQRFFGLILVLEHRYYGQSLPFGNSSFSMENFKYLNSEQALSDLAYFTNWIKTTKQYGVTNNPWISIGGSYPGALSAWYRQKYPYLTIGSIASSAVILAIQNFRDFDAQMYNSSVKSGDWCSKALNDSSTRVQQILKTSQGLAFKQQYEGGDKLNDNQFLFFWVDALVGQIQYGKRKQLCDSLKGKTFDQQFQYLRDNVGKWNDVYEYGSYYLKDQKFAVQNGQGARSWYYQSCTEYGFWQTFSQAHPMRPFSLDINFYKKFCSDSYGPGIWPQVDRKNTQYGGLQINATNLLMSNGDEDPWRWASLQQSKPGIISRVAVCDNCAHCVDLYTPTISDPSELKAIRNEQFIKLQGWIEDYWKNNKVSPKQFFNIRTQ